jgi:hypothetical protein
VADEDALLENASSGVKASGIKEAIEKATA